MGKLYAINGRGSGGKSPAAANRTAIAAGNRGAAAVPMGQIRYAFGVTKVKGMAGRHLNLRLDANAHRI
jgi:hypothetical protein